MLIDFDFLLSKWKDDFDMNGCLCEGQNEWIDESLYKDLKKIIEYDFNEYERM